MKTALKNDILSRTQLHLNPKKKQSLLIVDNNSSSSSSKRKNSARRKNQSILAKLEKKTTINSEIELINKDLASRDLSRTFYEPIRLDQLADQEPGIQLESDMENEEEAYLERKRQIEKESEIDFRIEKARKRKIAEEMIN